MNKIQITHVSRKQFIHSYVCLWVAREDGVGWFITLGTVISLALTSSLMTAAEHRGPGKQKEPTPTRTQECEGQSGWPQQRWLDDGGNKAWVFCPVSSLRIKTPWIMTPVGSQPFFVWLLGSWFIEWTQWADTVKDLLFCLFYFPSVMFFFLAVCLCLLSD